MLGSLAPRNQDELPAIHNNRHQVFLQALGSSSSSCQPYRQDRGHNDSSSCHNQRPVLASLRHHGSSSTNISTSTSTSNSNSKCLISCNSRQTITFLCHRAACTRTRQDSGDRPDLPQRCSAVSHCGAGEQVRSEDWSMLAVSKHTLGYATKRSTRLWQEAGSGFVFVLRRGLFVPPTSESELAHLLRLMVDPNKRVLEMITENRHRRLCATGGARHCSSFTST